MLNASWAYSIAAIAIAKTGLPRAHLQGKKFSVSIAGALTYWLVGEMSRQEFAALGEPSHVTDRHFRISVRS